jgi:hypothetical protein
MLFFWQLLQATSLRRGNSFSACAEKVARAAANSLAAGIKSTNPVVGLPAMT